MYISKRILFRLKNSPSTFQRSIEINLRAVRWKCVLIYVKDRIAFSPNMEEHFDHLEQVLTLQHNAIVTLRLAKREFFQTKVGYLGVVIKSRELMLVTTCQRGFQRRYHPQI